ncbi:AfsR/SARP family transcriptional regulator [Nonomuraea sp. NBC_01738]|uniref:AfsR/SARP family transcriptional regulator n=1 Tax=Nonomuraea sp. NBC_01738 TaxID=2976003 RepID=UPI002E14DC5E|nr:AfsR/SARP family transcriptional regulator [Nonomuraea sp. NBC_01738]
MNVNLLGPLRIWREGVDVTPSAPKLRRMLSLLVVHANTVVPNEQIIEELWEGRPPATVTTTLQTYVYQLRKALRHRERHQFAGLHTSLGGYLMSLPPESVDWLRFERLAHTGHAHLEAGDFQRAGATLSEALALWKGPVLADVTPGPVLCAEALRLEELRKSALEERIEADLQLGRHQDVLGELGTLAAEQLTHEGFQAKLMLALYRADRGQEALGVYQRTCAALAAELGLDPSHRLRRIHHAMLSADRSLDAPTVRSKVAVPRTHARRAGRLVGRQPQVEAALGGLVASQRHAPPVVLVVGPPGSGKSALCTQVSDQSGERYPDGQIHARATDAAGRPNDAGWLLLSLLRAVGMPPDRIPASTDERARMFRSHTAERQMLIMIDDVVHMRQLVPLLPSNEACGVLVAGRRMLCGPEITRTVELRPLDILDGVELLSGALGACRVTAEPMAAKELVWLCEGLPSMLAEVAGRLLRHPDESLDDAVTWVRHELDSLQEMRASVERSYRLAAPAVQQAFRLLSTAIEFPVSASSAAWLLGISESQAEYRLEELVDLRLVEVALPGHSRRPHYRLRRSVRRVAQRLCSEAGEALSSTPSSTPSSKPPVLPVPRQVAIPTLLEARNDRQPEISAAEIPAPART